MTADKKNSIQNLLEQIEKVEKMILFHSSNPSSLMASQYTEMKQRYFSQLIAELMDLQNLSKYSFKLIYLALNKYYPELNDTNTTSETISSKPKRSPREFRELASRLVA
jgi:hypothetical protein